MDILWGKAFIGIPTAVVQLFKSKDLLRLRDIRLGHLKYMLIFSLAPIFANMQGSLFPGPVSLFEIDAMTFMGGAYCIGAGLFFIFMTPGQLTRISQGGSGITLIFFLSYLILSLNFPTSVLPAGFPISQLQLALIFAILFMFSLGGCAACAVIAYTFTLNNSERFAGAVLISLFFALNQLSFALDLFSGFSSKIYLTCIVVGTVLCMFQYKDEDFATEEKGAAGTADSSRRALTSPLKLTLFFFVAHYLVEIFYTYLPGASAKEAILSNGTVGILVIIIAFSLQRMTQMSVWHMCNLFFAAEICTYLLYFMPELSIWRDVARGLHGFEQMGYLAAYYMLGCMFKKYGNFFIFKRCLAVILPLSALVYAIPGAICAYIPELLPLIATLTSGIIFVVFIFLSPAYSKSIFARPWEDINGNPESGAGNSEFRAENSEFRAENPEAGTDRTEAINAGLGENLSGYDIYFEKAGCSFREREIGKQLLQGKSPKEIGSDLGISVNTVNFHVKNLYKKLKISNRTELFATLYNLKK